MYKAVQSIVELERPSAMLKGLNLNTEFDDKIPSCLVGDSAKLHRIILNLVGNALKFTDEGSVLIRLNCLEKTDTDIQLQVCVMDTGIGIAPEFQGKVFEKFTRATPSYKSSHKGHGLGLHIAYIYAKALGGDIHFTTEVNKGTTFFVELLLKIGKASDIQQMLEQKTELPKEISKPKEQRQSTKFKSTVRSSALPADAPHLLLVEDNHIALLTLENLVRKSGCRYTSVDDGEGALKLATSKDFDLIITDIGLPGISGVEFVQQLRAYEQNQQKKPVPIIGLTAHSQGKAMEECKEAGMNEAMFKPMTAQALEQIKATYIGLAPQEKLGEGLPDTEEELFQLEHFALFDADNGLESVGNDLNMLKTILSSMLEDTLADKLELEKAYASQDWARLEKLAHRMKGGFVYCGTIRLTYAAQYLERYRKAGHSQSLEPLYQQLLKTIEETLPIIKEWLDHN